MPRNKNQKQQHDAKRKEKRKRKASYGLHRQDAPKKIFSAASQSNSNVFFKPQPHITVSSETVPFLQTTVDVEGFKINGFPISLSNLPRDFKKVANYFLSLLLLMQTVEAVDFKQQFFSIANNTIRIDVNKYFSGFYTLPDQQVVNCGGEELNFTPSGNFSLIYQIFSLINERAIHKEVVEKLFSLVNSTLPKEIENCLINEMDNSMTPTKENAIELVIGVFVLASCLAICAATGYGVYKVYQKLSCNNPACQDNEGILKEDSLLLKH